MLESCKSEGSVSLPSLYSNCLTRAEEKYVYFLGYWAFTVGHNRSGSGVFEVFPCLGEGAVLGDRSVWHSKPLGFHRSTAALETPAGLGCLCYRNSGHVHFPLTATARIFSSHFFPIPTWLVFFAPWDDFYSHVSGAAVSCGTPFCAQAPQYCSSDSAWAGCLSAPQPFNLFPALLSEYLWSPNLPQPLLPLVR